MVGKMKRQSFSTPPGDYFMHQSNQTIFHSIVFHPKYSPPSFNNDLALLELHKSVNFSPLVIPICIPDNVNDLVGKTGWITGWGAQYGKFFDGQPLVAVQP